jgi:hypothetical protein
MIWMRMSQSLYLQDHDLDDECRYLVEESFLAVNLIIVYWEECRTAA